MGFPLTTVQIKTEKGLTMILISFLIYSEPLDISRASRSLSEVALRQITPFLPVSCHKISLGSLPPNRLLFAVSKTTEKGSLLSLFLPPTTTTTTITTTQNKIKLNNNNNNNNKQITPPLPHTDIQKKIF